MTVAVRAVGSRLEMGEGEYCRRGNVMKRLSAKQTNDIENKPTQINKNIPVLSTLPSLCRAGQCDIL